MVLTDCGNAGSTTIFFIELAYAGIFLALTSNDCVDLVFEGSPRWSFDVWD
jgi:hypothetical protein